MIQKVIDVLKKDLDKNINTINFIENQEITFHKLLNKSSLIKGISDELWVYLNPENESDLKELLKFTKEDQFFFGESWVIPFIGEDPDFEWKLECEKLVLPKEVNIPKPLTNVFPLMETDAEYIQEHHSYADFTDVSYIKERIRNGVAFGIRVDKKLVAWAMTHDDGAIGFLYVLPNHRGMGYAQDITDKMILEIRRRGKLPFVHVEKENKKSISLAKKVGFIPHSSVTWVKKRGI